MSDERPHLRTVESLSKEAKRWRNALRAGDAAARARLERAFPNAPARPTLRDVQHALAREHGFAGWTALKAAVESTRMAARDAGVLALARHEDMADALLEAYRTGTPEAMERHYQYTWHRRAWRGMRTYVQLDLGKRPAHEDDDIEITLDDARLLVALEHGFRNWDDVRAFTASTRVGPRIVAKPLRLVTREESGDWRPIASARDLDEIVELLGAHPSTGLSGEGQMTDTMLEEISRVGTLTALGLSGCRAVTDDGVRHLARLPTLQHLDLSGTGITDAGLEVLRQLPNLRTLSLASTRVTDAGAAALASCDEVENLNLSGTRAGDGALHALAGKRRLRQLAIALSDAGLSLLHQLPIFKSWHGGDARQTLTFADVLPNHLSLRGTFTDAGMQRLRGLDGLFSLDIDDANLGITSAGIEPLHSLPQLGALRVDAKEDWMPHLAAMPRLRFLIAQDTSAGDDGFVALARSQTIEYIWGRRCHNLRRRGFLALARMPALRSLSVSCLNVDDEALAALSDFPVLKELMPMDVPDAGYRHVARCAGLVALVLMYCRNTTDAATEHITGLRNLTYYFNSYTTITDRTPALLSTMDSLERVTFDTCHGPTNAGVAQLARLPKLREVGASGRGITPEVRNAFPLRVRVTAGP